MNRGYALYAFLLGVAWLAVIGGYVVIEQLTEWVL
jgi:hypothetical protein